MVQIRYPYLARSLKALRIIHNISQRKFAELLGVGKASIFYWESQRNNPRRDQLDRIAEFFHEDLEDILYCPTYYEIKADKARIKRRKEKAKDDYQKNRKAINEWRRKYYRLNKDHINEVRRRRYARIKAARQMFSKD